MPEPNTPAAPATQEPSGQPAAPATPVQAGESKIDPFLVVNDRTSYADRDAAIKGVTELQNSYTKLTPWADASSRWAKSPDEGGFGLSEVNPDVIEQFLMELADRRYKEAQAKSASQPAPAQGGTAFDQWLAQQPPEHQKYIQYLTDQAKFVRADDVDAKFQQFRQEQAEREQERQVNAAISEGQSLLAVAAKDAGLPTDAEFLSDLFEAIQARVMKQSRYVGQDGEEHARSGSLEERYFSGDSSVRREIITAEVKRWADQLGSYAKAKNAAQANEKAKAMGSQPRNLPAGGAALPASGKRPTESERRQNLMAILSQESA